MASIFAPKHILNTLTLTPNPNGQPKSLMTNTFAPKQTLNTLTLNSNPNGAHSRTHAFTWRFQANQFRHSFSKLCSKSFWRLNTPLEHPLKNP